MFNVINKFRLLTAVLILLSVPGISKPQIEPQPHRDGVEETGYDDVEHKEEKNVLTRAPELAVYVDPVYPPHLHKEEIEGEVILLLTVSKEGLVSDAEIVDSPHDGLSEAAVEAALQLEFIPAEIDGMPAAVLIEFSYVFSLDIESFRKREGRHEVVEDIYGEESSAWEEGADKEADPDADPDADLDMEPEPYPDPDTEMDPDKVVYPADITEGSILQEAEAEEVIKSSVSLSGRVLTRGNRDPVDGAYIISGDDYVTADSDGYFELFLEEDILHKISVRAGGYHDFETSEIISSGEKLEVIYYLQRRFDSPYETVIRAQRPRKEVSRIILTREESQRVPGTFGDPIRVIENLPGMARSSFVGGQLLVRGARPENSSVLFDGVDIPILYHFGGLTSVVNAEFIEEIDFLPGGFGAEYGRATAGIVDVKPRRLIGEPARGSVKIDLMDTSIFYRRPFGDSLAAGFALRRSYIDIVLPLLLNIYSGGGTGGLAVLAPVYSDYQFKIDWNPSVNHDLDFFFFGSRDTLELLTEGSLRAHGFEMDLGLSFHRAMIAHRWRITPDLTLRTRPFFGMTIQGADGGEVEGDFQFDVNLGLLEMGLRQDLTWSPHQSIRFRTGLDIYSLIEGKAQFEAPLPGELLAFPSPIQHIPENQSFEESDSVSGTGIFAEAVWEPLEKLQLVPGLRMEFYVMPEETWPVFEPRLSIRYGLFNNTTFKAATGIYHNPPTMIEANPLIGNPALRPERARHLVFGMERILSDALDIDLQLFHNRYTDLVYVSSDSTITDGTVERSRFLNTGDGFSYGAEAMLRHRITARAFGWLAYTIMRSERRASPESAYRITSFDQTHILTLVGSYKLGGGFEAGARFRLVTGNPYTPVTDSTHDLDTDGWRPVYGDPLSERMPTFHQLDLRIDYTRVYNTFTLTAFADLLNAYNQANVEGFQYDYRYRNRVNFNGLPFVPVFGIKGDW